MFDKSPVNKHKTKLHIHRNVKFKCAAKDLASYFNYFDMPGFQMLKSITLNIFQIKI